MEGKRLEEESIQVNSRVVNETQAANFYHGDDFDASTSVTDHAYTQPQPVHPTNHTTLSNSTITPPKPSVPLENPGNKTVSNTVSNLSLA